MAKILNQIKSLRRGLGTPTQQSGARQRAVSAQIINKVISHDKSLTVALEDYATQSLDINMSWIKQACYGTLRRYYQLQAIIDHLVPKPIPSKHGDIQCLLLVGLYQLEFMDTPDYAAVNETVAATKILKKTWAKGLCNKVLRRYLKQREQINKQLMQTPTVRYSHPQWLIERVQHAWPEQWQDILDNNNLQAPLFLRLNQRHSTPERYQQLVQNAAVTADFSAAPTTCIKLEQAVPVEKIPGFSDGFVSVQDISGQWVTPLLDLQPGHNVLDACAAPGSKTCHMLEQELNLNRLVAIDIDADRLLKIKQNMVRLKLPASSLRLILADAAHTKEWWDGQLFDRISLDVPCSATGVIRRHPDIKLLRQPKDVDDVIKVQHYLLRSIWPLLAPGGRLVYSTCSILPEENEQQIERFLKVQSDAKTIAVDIPYGISQKHGHQCLPTYEGGDGFYYCILTKTKP